MRTNSRPEILTFGEFIAQAYRVWGRRKAGGMVRLALRSHLVALRPDRKIHSHE